jgi:hypothetical protein
MISFMRYFFCLFRISKHDVTKATGLVGDGVSHYFQENNFAKTVEEIE